MSQDELFPPKIATPSWVSDYVRWLAAVRVRNPVTMEARFKDAYPHVDLEAEGKIAISWNEAQPHPYKNIAKFLHNWYSKKERDYILCVRTQAALTPSRTFKEGYVKTNAGSDKGSGNPDGK